MTARIASLATAFALLGATAEATTITWPFHGCEAADVAALAASAAASAAATAWSGDAHALGPWTLRHTASLDCAGGDCRALLTLSTDQAGKLLAASPAPAPLALTTRGRHQGQSLTLDGEAARSLHANLGAGAFHHDGAVKRVLMDYGTLAEAVSVRIRTEVSCTPDAAACTITADPAAFIPYNDDIACGSFARALLATN